MAEAEGWQMIIPVGGVVGVIMVLLIIGWFIASAVAGDPIERAKRDQEKRDRKLRERDGG
jgi:cell division protein FtsX